MIRCILTSATWIFPKSVRSIPLFVPDATDISLPLAGHAPSAQIARLWARRNNKCALSTSGVRGSSVFMDVGINLAGGTLK